MKNRSSFNIYCRNIIIATIALYRDTASHGCRNREIIQWNL
jgi:hypothetical protein